MGKAKRYSMEQIQAAQKRLRSLASRVVGKSKKETVDFLAEDIRKALKQGHSLTSIQKALEEAGIPASASSMKALLHQGEVPDTNSANEEKADRKDTAPSPGERQNPASSTTYTQGEPV